MNLWLRLIAYLLGFCRGDVRGDFRFTVGLTDLDINGHVNNGRFLELMDLGRLDWFWRSPFRAAMFTQRSVPILGGVLIRYRLPMDMGHKVSLQTRLVCFEDNWMVMEQRFVLKSGDKPDAVAAIALCKCGFYDRSNRTLHNPRDVFVLYGEAEPAGDCHESVALWRAADLSLKELARTS